MKKLFYFFAAAAASLLSFSCSVELETIDEENENPGFEYFFRVCDANQDATKTVLNGANVEWEVSDRIAVFAEGTTNRYGAISSLNPVVFPVSLSKALTTGNKVYAYFPYSSTNNSASADAVTLSIPSVQRGDFDHMPQVALPYTTTSDFVSGNNNVGDLYFCNLGSVIKFLVYSSGGAYTGETVESIVFNADKALAGSFSFDLTSVDYSNPSTLSIEGYAGTSVKLEPVDAPTIGTTTENAGSTNMVVAPGTYYGIIVLTTDVARYTYTLTESNKISFARNTIKKIGLNLESANCTRVIRHPVGEVFVPATSIAAGDKILLSSATSGSAYVFGNDKGSNRNAISYTISDGVIISNADTYPLIVGTGKTNDSYYTLYDIDYDGYVAAAGNSNSLKTKSSISVDAEWQIVIDASSLATTFEATASEYTKKILRYNKTSHLYSGYSTGQDAFYIFKKTAATVVLGSNQDIAYTVTSVEIPYSVYNGSGATTVAFKTNPGSCASNLAINEGTKKVTFDITTNTGSTRTVEVDITNNGVTKTVAINQAAAPTKLVMSSITATPDQNQIVFAWGAVANATGYQVSVNGGTTYLTKQDATSYTWTGLEPLTAYTIYVKAIGDGGVYYLDSDAANETATTLAPILTLPSSLSWNKISKTVSWTDTNTGAGTYGTDYKYVYTLDDGVTTSDATTSTTAVLTITEAATIKVKAVALTESHRSTGYTDGLSCSFAEEKYYVKVTSLSQITSGGVYLIINEDHEAFGPYTSNAKVSPSDISANYDSVNDRFPNNVDAVNASAITLEDPFTAKSNTYMLKMSNDKYVARSGSSGTKFNAAVETPSSTSVDWTFAVSIQGSNRFSITSVSSSTRGIIWDGSDFGAFATSNIKATPVTYYDVYLYKLED